MKISVILAHPDKNSFNHAIAKTVVETLTTNGYQVYYHDLYDEKFDPLLFHPEFLEDAELPNEIRLYCDEISSADGIVIVHPNWWGQPPAILKGWIDRVLRPGVAYQFLDGDSGEGIPIGLLKAKVALVFNTSNTSAEREVKVFGDPLERLWKACILEFCGVKTFDRRMYRIVIISTEEQRQAWLNETRDMVNNYFPEKET
jgi:NAD(P)H dehydrogenase (quinone)